MSDTTVLAAIVLAASLAVLAWWRFLALAREARPKRSAQLAGAVLIGCGCAPVLDAIGGWSLTGWEQLLAGVVLGLAASVAAPEALRWLRARRQ